MERKFGRLSHMAWGAILGYEITSPPGETLSEGLDEFVDSENKLVKWGTRAIIGYTALHLMNMLPEKLDAYHQLSVLKEKALEKLGER